MDEDSIKATAFAEAEARRQKIADSLNRYGLACRFRNNGTVDILDRNHGNRFITNLPYDQTGLIIPDHHPILHDL